ncbi:hypothetical protein IPH92_00035 [Candidatus Kaiserbacteria bacterium]|nr:MAG: hypothetical protein IPH92_00035 [Candidatus Kaiserbacteria bacterium]
MSLRDTLVTTIIALVFTPMVFFGVSLTSAQVMQSTNYRIQSDSVNFGGGLSTSTNYSLESTAGEVATGDSTSTNYNLKAGYQQMLTTFISMTAASSILMTPSIPGISGGIANGSTTVTVTTDSAAGYQMTIAASQSPAMQKGSDTIPDYVPVGNPDFTFITNPADAHLGYSPSGVDVTSRFKDNGALCGTGGTQEADLACWDGLSMSAVEIVRRMSANTPNGSTTTVNFRVGIGGSVVQTSGTYVATTTLTAIAL